VTPCLAFVATAWLVLGPAPSPGPSFGSPAKGVDAAVKGARRGAAAGRQDRSGLPRFDDWFRRYRDGKIIFQLRGGRAPSGTEVDTFAPDGPFQRALMECVKSKAPSGADRLLELATFHFSESPADELEGFAVQCPERVREEALSALARMRSPEVMDYLTREVLLERSKTAPKKRAAAAAAIGLVKDRNFALALYSATSDAAPEVRAAAVSAAAEFADVRSSLLTRWLVDPDSDVRLLALGAAAQALSRSPAEPEKSDILDKVLARLGDEDWRVRERAIDVAAAYPSKASIGPLIQMLGGELDGIAKKTGRKRVARRAGDALIHLTSIEIPPLDVGRWRRWWENAEPRFEVGSHSPGTPRTVADSATYFTIAVKSDRMVFVVDTSGSMNELFGDLYAGTGAAPKGKEGRQGASKLDRLKEELIRVIRNLDDGDRFQIVAFSSQVKTAFPSLTFATKDQKRAAERFVKLLVADGGTALWNGLEAALKQSCAVPGLAATGADTIFLLTDGEPTSGSLVEPADITRAVQTLNRGARVEVNTIFVGPESGAGALLLAQLARDSGGEYRRVDDK
jgi:HEAT repeat protein